MYIYIHIYIYIHTHIYIYIYMYKVHIAFSILVRPSLSPAPPKPSEKPEMLNRLLAKRNGTKNGSPLLCETGNLWENDGTNGF